VSDEPQATPQVPPAPPWDKRPLQRRRALTREGIIDAALGVVRADGTDALTMRRVAAELGVVASSLYARVGSRDELLRLAVRQVVEGAGRIGDTGDWRDDFATYFVDLHRRLSLYGDLVRYAFAEAPPAGEGDLVETEQLLARLIKDGLPPRVAVWAFDRLMLYTIADVYESWRFSQETGDREMGAWLAQMHDYLLALPADQYPTISTYADLIVDPRLEERFLQGLELMLDGIVAKRGTATEHG
jgi:AcrR family transcriptional regulator